ncbi:MAG: DUF5318 domain-containing protein [Candidatus Nanopelagicales bacterium]|jgi:hypothetical protein|nr:DUF5318 domain-containing protein [Candidatus Nanopelagicales bacterium]
MPGRRTPSIRGTRTPAPSTPPRPDPDEFAPEEVADPQRPRDVVSFALARRSALESLRRGGAFTSEHCDAEPGLLRAAKHHGEAAGRPCPVCRRDLVEVTWVYGAQLGPLSGSARASAQLPVMALEHGRFRVYVVEVCQRCGWNHLVISYTLGDGVPRAIGRSAR